jgi:SAM-dependent methyltransferase
VTYDQVINELRRSCDREVEERDGREVAAWKLGARQQFLALLQRETRQKLLEIGAGTGVHGEFFQKCGLDVICTDLSPAMVKRCRERGLDPCAMGSLDLDLPDGSFDAVSAMNCLLHVPNVDVPRVLSRIRDLL